MGYSKHKEETRLRLDISGSQLENVEMLILDVVGCRHWYRPLHVPRGIASCTSNKRISADESQI